MKNLRCDVHLLPLSISGLLKHVLGSAAARMFIGALKLVLSSDHDFLDVGKIYTSICISCGFSHHLLNGFCDPVACAHCTFRLLLEQETKKTTFADSLGNSVEVVGCVNGLKRLLEFRRQQGWGIGNIGIQLRLKREINSNEDKVVGVRYRFHSIVAHTRSFQVIESNLSPSVGYWTVLSVLREHTAIARLGFLVALNQTCDCLRHSIAAMLSSPWALARAAAMAPIEGLERCIDGLFHGVSVDPNVDPICRHQ